MGQITSDARKYNAKQIEIMRALAEHGFGTFDRWRSLIINEEDITGHHSLVPYTLFINGMIAMKEGRVYLTRDGFEFLRDLKVQLPDVVTYITPVNVVDRTPGAFNVQTDS